MELRIPVSVNVFEELSSVGTKTVKNFKCSNSALSKIHSYLSMYIQEAYKKVEAEGRNAEAKRKHGSVCSSPIFNIPVHKVRRFTIKSILRYLFKVQILMIFINRVEISNSAY